jgi:uncharacterized protein (DUF427 family)
MSVDRDDVALHPAEIDGYNIDIEPGRGRIAAVINDAVVADSARALVLRETFLAPGIYFPREDVDQALLQRSEFRTFCPFKGTASHWSLKLADGLIENAAWSYERPLSVGIPLGDYISFYPDKIDEWRGDADMTAVLDEEPVSHPGAFEIGRAHV